MHWCHRQRRSRRLRGRGQYALGLARTRSRASVLAPGGRRCYNSGALPATYVAFDLETTGLDPQSDAIIEIGAVKFTREGVLDRFDTLVNPYRPIPERVQQLAGIRHEDVRDAPPLEAVAADLERFIEGCPLVGSNVIGFDAPLLDARGVRHSGEIFDTHDLASLLLPGLGEYGLAGLARHFEIDMPVHHRALADAETSRLVFLALAREAAALPAGGLSQGAG